MFFERRTIGSVSDWGPWCCVLSTQFEARGASLSVLRAQGEELIAGIAMSLIVVFRVVLSTRSRRSPLESGRLAVAP